MTLDTPPPIDPRLAAEDFQRIIDDLRFELRAASKEITGLVQAQVKHAREFQAMKSRLTKALEPFAVAWQRRCGAGSDESAHSAKQFVGARHFEAAHRALAPKPTSTKGAGTPQECGRPGY
jgi:hypothetical protein